MTGSEEGVKIPDYKLSPIIAYWNGKHFPIEFVVYRCPVDGSIGERGSFCPGHDDGPYGRGGHDRVPVRIPWVGEVEELKREIADLEAENERA